MAEWRMKGQYLKNCSCVAGCPCDTWGYPGPNEFCEGVIGMNVTGGELRGHRPEWLQMDRRGALAKGASRWQRDCRDLHR